MKNFIKKQKETVVMLAYALLLGGLVMFVVLPLINKITQTSDLIQEENLKEEAKRQRINEIPKTKQEYSMLQDNEGEMDVVFSKDKAVVLIERLEKLASDTGNTIEINVQDNAAPVVSKSGPAGKGKTQDNTIAGNLPSTDYTQMNLQISGDYNSIANFISRVENLQYYSDIIAIDIKKHEDTASPDQNSNSNGILNPFDMVNAKNNVQQPKKQIQQAELDATLSMVFYNQKN